MISKYKRKSTAKRIVKSTLNKWKTSRTRNMGKGLIIIDQVNLAKNAKYSERIIRLFARQKEVDIMYTTRNGKSVYYKTKFTNGWRKLAISASRK